MASESSIGQCSSHSRSSVHGGMHAMSSIAWRFAGIAVVPLAAFLSAQVDPGQAVFLEWSRRALRPLTSLGSDAPPADLRWLAGALRNVDVVALGEADHGIAEPLEFRNRLFKYLVEEHGFAAIAIESGLTESRVVYDFVHGGSGELQEVLAQGLSWTFDNLPQNAELIRWMRAYNADPRHTRKISFYGLDVPGSPGNPQVKRGMRTGIDDALRFVQRVDPPAAADLNQRLDPLLPNVRAPRDTSGPGYANLTPAERDRMTAAIADVVTIFEHRAAKYTAATSSTDYAWAYRSALGARAVDAWLRSMVRDGRAGRNSLEIRDHLQGDNVRWIVDREKPNGKVLLYTAWVHIATTPLAIFGATQPDLQLAGTYHRRHFGNRLLTIGHMFRRGHWYCGPDVVTRDEAVAGSLSHLLGGLKRSNFLLDLRTAPPEVRTWLDRERVVSDEYPWNKYELNVARGFDMLVYTDAVTGACGR
jgi:erythromycin esterase